MFFGLQGKVVDIRMQISLILSPIVLYVLWLCARWSIGILFLLLLALSGVIVWQVMRLKRESREDEELLADTIIEETLP